MEGTEGASQEGHACGRSRRTGEIDVETLVEERLPYRGAGLEIGHHDGNDRRLRCFGAKGEAELAEAGVEALAVLPQMRALIGAVHQLADRGGGDGNDRRWQRSGEHVGPADEAQYLELGMVGDAEAPDGANRLGEG